MSDLNIATSALATLNSTRINLYKESAPLAIVATLTYAAPHGERHWVFTNLEPSVAYRYRYLEIDGGGATIQQYVSMVLTTPAAGSIEHRTAAYLTVDVTPGLVSGSLTATFDGTGGTEDYRGWNIILFRPGLGPQYPGEHYDWNSTTGELSQPIETFIAIDKYVIQFEPKVIPSGGVLLQNLYLGVLVKTASATLTDADVKNKIIIEGAGAYLDLTLPDISLVPENQMIYFESGIGSHKSATIISVNGNLIKWLEGGRTRLYMGRCESLVMYHYGGVWRVQDAEGNFKSVGQEVSEFAPVATIFNKIELNDTVYSALEYARLYNDYILKLPIDEVVSFINWPTGNNRYKYSLANGSNQFHVPDIRGLYERSVSADNLLPGTFLEQDVQELTGTLVQGNSYTGSGAGGIVGRGSVSPNNINITINSGHTITRPKSYTTRKFVLV